MHGQRGAALWGLRVAAVSAEPFTASAPRVDPGIPQRWSRVGGVRGITVPAVGVRAVRRWPQVRPRVTVVKRGRLDGARWAAEWAGRERQPLSVGGRREDERTVWVAVGGRQARDNAADRPECATQPAAFTALASHVGRPISSGCKPCSNGASATRAGTPRSLSTVPGGTPRSRSTVPGGTTPSISTMPG